MNPVPPITSMRISISLKKRGQRHPVDRARGQGLGEDESRECMLAQLARGVLPAEGGLTGAGARDQPTQPTGGAAPELEISLGESALLLDLPGPLWPSPVGGHQFGQAGSRGPHAGGNGRIAIRALTPELRLANCSRYAHLTPL